MTAGLLLPVGSLTALLSLRPGQRRLLPLALAPLFFGLQQLAEGLVWLGLAEGEPAVANASVAGFTAAAALVYLFFAYGFWPLWIPWSACNLLPRDRRGWPIRLLLLLGALPGLLLWLPMLVQPHRAIPRIVSGSLAYGMPAGMSTLLPADVGPLLYVALIVVPLALVPALRPRLFALTLLVSFLLSRWMYSHALSSVWCYASAVLSIQILGMAAAPRSREPLGEAA